MNTNDIIINHSFHQEQQGAVKNRIHFALACVDRYVYSAKLHERTFKMRTNFMKVNCALVSYYAASGCNSSPTFGDNLSVPSSGSSITTKKPLKIEPVGYPEMSVNNCHYSLRNSPEECSSPLLLGGSLKSHVTVKEFLLTTMLL